MRNLKSYLDYVAAFNSQDWNRVAHEFYAPDIEIVFPIVTLSGRDEALAWFATAHGSLFETLVPQTIELTDDGVVADIVVQFVLLGPTRFSPLGEEGETGDVVTVPMRADYRVGADGLVTSLVVEFTAPPRKDGKIIPAEAALR